MTLPGVAHGEERGSQMSKQALQLSAGPKSSSVWEQVNSHWTMTSPLPAPWGRIASEGETAYFQQRDSPPLSSTCHLGQHRALRTVVKSCQRTLPLQNIQETLGRRGGGCAQNSGVSLAPVKQDGVYFPLEEGLEGQQI